jgi:hypothetical protein
MVGYACGLGHAAFTRCDVRCKAEIHLESKPVRAGRGELESGEYPANMCPSKRLKQDAEVGNSRQAQDARA